MALLKLDKRTQPGWCTPGCKPAGTLQVDWSNPLTSGLKFLVLPFSGHVDLVNGIRPNEFNGPGTIETNRNSLYLNNKRIGYPPAPQVNNMDAPTFFVRTRNKVGDTGYQAAIGGLNGENGSAFNSLIFDFIGTEWSNQRPVIRPAMNIGGLTRTTSFAATQTSMGDGGVNWAWSYDGLGTVKQRIGRETQIDSYSGSLAGNTEYSFIINGQFNSSGGYEGVYEICAVWDRPLSDGEWESLNKDPYQIVKPANDFYYTVPAGGGTSVSVEVPEAIFGFTTFAPTVSTSSNVAIEVPTGAFAFTPFAPTVTASDNQSIEVPTATFGFTSFAPDVEVGQAFTVEVPTASFSFTSFAPKVTTVSSPDVAIELLSPIDPSDTELQGSITSSVEYLSAIDPTGEELTGGITAVLEYLSAIDSTDEELTGIITPSIELLSSIDPSAVELTTPID